MLAGCRGGKRLYGLMRKAALYIGKNVVQTELAGETIWGPQM